MSILSIQIGIIVTIIAVIIFDIWLMIGDDVEDNTYSSILRVWFKSHVWLYYLTSFALGVLMGHWGPR